MNIRPAREEEAQVLSALAMRALSRALRTAAQGGAKKVTVDADPNAAAFYLRSGATQTGVVAAPIPGETERVRPQLEFENGK